MAIAIFVLLTVLLIYVLLRFIRMFPQSSWEDDYEVTQQQHREFERFLHVNRQLLVHCANLVAVDEKLEVIYQQNSMPDEIVLGALAVTATKRQEMYEKLELLGLVTEDKSHLKIHTPANDDNVIHVKFR